jgi:hypothetical protein
VIICWQRAKKMPIKSFNELVDYLLLPYGCICDIDPDGTILVFENEEMMTLFLLRFS